MQIQKQMFRHKMQMNDKLQAGALVVQLANKTQMNSIHIFRSAKTFGIQFITTQNNFRKICSSTLKND